MRIVRSRSSEGRPVSDETPVHLGTLERSGTVETPDGVKLKLETSQGEFLLTADAKTPLDALVQSVEMYTHDVVRGESDE